jgi:hypothetical protein
MSNFDLKKYLAEGKLLNETLIGRNKYVDGIKYDLAIDPITKKQSWVKSEYQPGDDSVTSGNDSFTISFIPNPLETTFYVDDFDDEKEFQEFKKKLKSNEKLAYKIFFDNFDFDNAMDRQNQDNWRIEIK